MAGKRAAENPTVPSRKSQRHNTQHAEKERGEQLEDYKRKLTSQITINVTGFVGQINGDTERRANSNYSESYDMQGALAAITSARSGNVLTVTKTGSANGEPNTHSELMAVHSMIEKRLWTLENGKIRANSAKVKPEDFTTYAETKDEGEAIETFPIPHCGCCSIMIHVLDLPFTQASTGKHNYLAARRYPVPLKIKYDPHVISNFVNGFKDQADTHTLDKWGSLERVCKRLYVLMPDNERTESAERDLETWLQSKTPGGGALPSPIMGIIWSCVVAAFAAVLC